MEEKDYTLKELSVLFKTSIRTLSRQIADLVKRDKKRVLVPFDIVKVLYTRHYLGKLPTSAEQENEDDDTADVVWEYTNEEFAKLQKTLIEYPILKEQISYLKEQIEYHKKSVLKHQGQIDKILTTIEQRNYIEAKKEIIKQ